MMVKAPSGARSQIDLSKGSLPIILAISITCAVAASAYGVGSFVANLVNDRDESVKKFTAIDIELKAIRGLIENGNFLRRSEFEAWCRNAEIINKGFKCGNTK